MVESQRILHERLEIDIVKQARRAGDTIVKPLTPTFNGHHVQLQFRWSDLFSLLIQRHY